MKSSINNKKLREFGLLIGFAFPILIGWILPILVGHPFRYWTLFVGLPALFIGLIRPSLLKLPYKLWIKIGNILGWINSRLILGALFIFILIPISLIMKLKSYDPLKIKKNSLFSYREKKINHKINLDKVF